ncbi:MAG: DUF3817 domain-containing protein [Gemmatimonadales bacterium]|nr:DUF3817 domain-containing protein [Gemmatimonadales bacterium]
MIDRSFLKGLRVLSLVEGVSTLALFGIAMPLKYFADMPGAVSLVGSIHGLLFVALVVTFLVGIQRIPLPKGVAFAGIAAAVVPFGPFIMDRRLERIASQPG